MICLEFFSSLFSFPTDLLHSIVVSGVVFLWDFHAGLRVYVYSMDHPLAICLLLVCFILFDFAGFYLLLFYIFKKHVCIQMSEPKETDGNSCSWRVGEDLRGNGGNT